MNRIEQLEKEYLELEEKALNCETKEEEQQMTERMVEIQKEINKLAFKR